MSDLRRWIPAASMLLLSLISYIDRSTLALLAPTILRETRLTAEQYGFIISAFSIAYMATNPLWGWLLDRTGLQRGLGSAVSFWTLASVAHAFAGGFWSFGAARAALGLGEGATFPGAMRTVVQTLPPEQRGRGLAVAFSGGSLGAAITPLVVTPIFLAAGWRGAFWFTGLVGAAWLALWSFVSRRADIRLRVERRAAGPAPRIRDARFWGLVCGYALGGLPLGFVLYNTSLYLSHALGLSQASIGKVLWIPPLGWEAGYFFWGWLADRLLSRAGFVRRLQWMVACCAAATLPFALLPSLSRVAVAMPALFFQMFVSAAFTVLPVVYAIRVYSGAHAGLIAGIGAGSWSAVVAVVMPVFGHLFDLRNYYAAFGLATALPVAGCLAWILLAGIAGEPGEKAQGRAFD